MYLTNLSKRPVNLPKNFAVGLAIPYECPVQGIPFDELPEPCDGADPLTTLGPAEGATSQVGEPTEPRAKTAQTGDSASATERPKMYVIGPEPMPRVAYELIPPALHGEVRELLARYKGLQNGQLGRSMQKTDSSKD